MGNTSSAEEDNIGHSSSYQRQYQHSQRTRPRPDQTSRDEFSYIEYPTQVSNNNHTIESHHSEQSTVSQHYTPPNNLRHCTEQSQTRGLDTHNRASSTISAAAIPSLSCPICGSLIPALEISEHIRRHDNNQVDRVSHVRQIECPLTKIFNKCSWKCDYTAPEEIPKQMTAHMRSFHSQHCKNRAGQEASLRSLTETDRYLFFNCINDTLFLTNFRIGLTQQLEQVLFMNCQIVGSNPSEWKFAIFFYRSSDNRAFRYEDTCQENVEPFEVKTSCAQIPINFLEELKENDELKFKFYFTKVTGRPKSHWNRP